MDISSESVLKSAFKKLSNDLINKRLTYLQRYDTGYKKVRVFSAWLKIIALVQENLRLQFGSASNEATPNFTKDRTKTTSFATTSDSGSPTEAQCPLEDGEHKVWQCDKFKKMKLAEHHELVKKLKLCLFCLGCGHRIGQCKANRTCGKESRSKRQNRLLHSDDNELETQKKQNSRKTIAIAA